MKKLLALTALCAFALTTNVEAAWLWPNGNGKDIKKKTEYKKAYRKKAANAHARSKKEKSGYLNGNGDMNEDYMTSKYQQKSNGNPHNSHKAMNNDSNDNDSWFGIGEEDDDEMIEVDLNQE